MPADAAHWDEAYSIAGADGVSWHEQEPTVSIELIERLGVERSSPVIDVGSGTSPLAGALLRIGYTDVTVLDLSSVALAEARRRLGSSDAVALVQADIRRWRPARRFSLWHDRACLHFLTSEADRRAYVQTLHAALEPGGGVVIGTFAEHGPPTCSGLAVERFSSGSLASLLGEGFELVDERTSLHVTPRGVEQPFVWIAARYVPRGDPQPDGGRASG